MLLGCLAGCKTPEKEPDATNGETTEESEETRPPEIGDSGLPAALDFGYEKVKILHRTQFKNELYAEEEDEGTVEQAIYGRNEFVQEKLKVAFEYVEVNEAYNQYAKMHDRILTSYSTGDGDVQIISGGAYYAPVLITQNVYYDLHSLNESKANYLDFGKVWWNSAFAEQAEISEKLYYATGDLTVSVTKEVEATVYNKDLFGSYFPNVDLLQVYRTIFTMLFYTGRRRGEVLALTPEDVKENRIRFNKTYSRKAIDGKPYNITSSKNEKKGETPICERLKRELEQYEGQSPFFFGGENPIHENTLSHAFESYIKKAGVKRIRMHDLRHSFVSMLIHLGANFMVVADLIGDTVEQVTKTYGHFYEADKPDIIAKFG